MAGYRCLEARDGMEAQSLALDNRPDLILLDWMLPVPRALNWHDDLNERKLPQKFHHHSHCQSGRDNKIQGLEVGADDYITKPFSPRELVARLSAVLRRTTPQGWETEIEVGDSGSIRLATG